MKKYSLGVIVASSLFVSACGFVGGVFGYRDMYGEPRHEVVSQISDNPIIQIREYAPALVAVTPSGNDEGESFMRLFRYIDGQNQSEAKVAMTTPVEMTEQQSSGAKIAMTTPVEMAGGEMVFFFPPEYTMDNAPQPINDAVTLKEINARTVASIRFSGTMNDAKKEEYAQILREALTVNGEWVVEGEATTMVYDPPFALPFLRRNEVVIPVSKK